MTLFQNLSIDVLSQIWSWLTNPADLQRITTLVGTRMMRMKFEHNTLLPDRQLSFDWSAESKDPRGTWISRVNNVAKLRLYTSNPEKDDDDDARLQALGLPTLQTLDCTVNEFLQLMPSQVFCNLTNLTVSSKYPTSSYIKMINVLLFNPNLSKLNRLELYMRDKHAITTCLQAFERIGLNNLPVLETLIIKYESSNLCIKDEKFGLVNTARLNQMVKGAPKRLKHLQIEGIIAHVFIVYALVNRTTLEHLTIDPNYSGYVPSDEIDAVQTMCHTCAQHVLGGVKLNYIDILLQSSSKLVFPHNCIEQRRLLQDSVLGDDKAFAANLIRTTTVIYTLNTYQSFLIPVVHPNIANVVFNVHDLNQFEAHWFNCKNLFTTLQSLTLHADPPLSRSQLSQISPTNWTNILSNMTCLRELYLTGSFVLPLHLLVSNTDNHYIAPPQTLVKFECAKYMWNFAQTRAYSALAQRELLGVTHDDLHTWTSHVFETSGSLWFYFIKSQLHKRIVIDLHFVNNGDELPHTVERLDDSLIVRSIFTYGYTDWTRMCPRSATRDAISDLYLSFMARAFFNQNPKYYGHQLKTFRFPQHLTRLYITLKPDRDKGELFYFHNLPNCIEVVEAPYVMWDMYPPPKTYTNQGKRTVIDFDEDDVESDGEVINYDEDNASIDISSSNDEVSEEEEIVQQAIRVKKSSSSKIVEPIPKVHYDDTVLSSEEVEAQVKLASKRMSNIKRLFVHSVYPLHALRGLGYKVESVRLHRDSAQRVIENPHLFTARERGCDLRTLQHKPRPRYDYVDAEKSMYEEFVPFIEIKRSQPPPKRAAPSTAKDSIHRMTKKKACLEKE
jgi:hypothetical protein